MFAGRECDARRGVAEIVRRDPGERWVRLLHALLRGRERAGAQVAGADDVAVRRQEEQVVGVIDAEQRSLNP